MNFVGVDLHKKIAVVCVVNQARQVLETRHLACSDPDGIRQWFAALGAFQVVVEATASYEWFVHGTRPAAHLFHGTEENRASPGPTEPVHAGSLRPTECRG